MPNHKPFWERGYVSLYTGNGKGKTTAALGLALRALGAGARVYVGQFIKASTSQAIDFELLQKQYRNPQLQVEYYGLGCNLIAQPGLPDRVAAGEGLKKASQVVGKGEYDLVILDELCVALHMQLIDRAGVEALLSVRPSHLELIITGRYAPEWLLRHCHLITEFQEIRHYFRQGVEARRGIE